MAVDPLKCKKAFVAPNPLVEAAQLMSVPSLVRTVAAEPLANLAVAPDALPYSREPLVIVASWLSSAVVRVAPANLFNSAVLAVAPVSLFNSAVLTVAPVNLFNSAALTVAPVNLFNSVFVEVKAVSNLRATTQASLASLLM
jgi:hypothetical protein